MGAFIPSSLFMILLSHILLWSDLSVMLSDYPNEAPLGMEDGRIPNNSLSSNSEWFEKNGAQYGRLHQKYGYGGWCSESTTQTSIHNPYLQIDFGGIVTVTAVATQGVDDNVINRDYYVMNYELEYRTSLTGQWKKMMNMITRKPQVCRFKSISRWL